MIELAPRDAYCLTCGSPARPLRGRSLDARYLLARCRRNGHVGASTFDVELAGRIRAAWLERSAPPARPLEASPEPWT